MYRFFLDLKNLLNISLAFCSLSTHLLRKWKKGRIRIKTNASCQRTERVSFVKYKYVDIKLFQRLIFQKKVCICNSFKKFRYNL